MTAIFSSLKSDTAHRESVSNIGGKFVNPDGPAWQREMERAQMQGWLDHDLVNRGHDIPESGEVSAEAAPKKWKAVAPFPLLSSQLVAAASQGVSSVSGMGDLPDVKPLIAHQDGNDELRLMADAIIRKLEGGGQVSEREEERDALGSAASTVETLAEDGWTRGMSLPRITLERVGAGMRVWLGVDAPHATDHEALQSLLSVVYDALRVSGVRLESIICNGQPVGLPSGVGYTQAGSFPAYYHFLQGV